MRKTRKIIVSLFLVILIANIGLWYKHRHIKPMWGNVPPVPSDFSMNLTSLGDKEFAYRIYAQKLQNMGDESGEGRRLSEYNYDNIYDWFVRLHQMSPNSEIIPYLAAYYYGASSKKDQVPYIIKFLRIAGLGGW